MKARAVKGTKQGPVVRFSEFAERIKAVAGGEEAVPEWASKKTFRFERIAQPEQAGEIRNRFSA